MGHQKHLRELLREDQEPFQLHNYIADRRCQLKTTHMKKHLMISKTSSSKLSLCRKACFISFNDSPELKKSPAKSPVTRFLHIPAKTAAMLLEAAMKIQSTKPKTHVQYIGFGLLGSFFKKLRDKNKVRKREIGVNRSVCNKITEEYDSCATPFRFALERSSDILSPVASPIAHNKEDHNNEDECSQKIQGVDEEKQDQCSPVSVLDPPFEDDEQHGGDEEDSDFDGYVECSSYAIVQRAKLQLLHKIRRFERLAELDPVELEKRMLETHEDDEVIDEEEECDYVNRSGSLYMQDNLDEVVKKVLSTSYKCDQNKTPSDVRQLLLDLIAEEKNSGWDCSGEVVVNKVCKRLNAWKEVESNTIDMMVELDFRKDVDGWKRYEDEVVDRARDIEVAIFGILVEELVS